MTKDNWDTSPQFAPIFAYFFDFNAMARHPSRVSQPCKLIVNNG
jgi:hypothetical protein